MVTATRSSEPGLTPQHARLSILVLAWGFQAIVTQSLLVRVEKKLADAKLAGGGAIEISE